MVVATVKKSLLAELGAVEPNEQVTPLIAASGVRIERIVSWGHSSPPGFWYDQDEAEWVAVLRGAARLRFADPEEVVEMEEGDSLEIAAHRRHRVEWTAPGEPTVWLAVFYEGSHGNGAATPCRNETVSDP